MNNADSEHEQKQSEAEQQEQADQVNDSPSFAHEPYTYDQGTEEMRARGIIVEAEVTNDAERGTTQADLTAQNVESELLDEGGVEILKNGKTYEASEEGEEEAPAP